MGSFSLCWELGAGGGEGTESPCYVELACSPPTPRPKPEAWGGEPQGAPFPPLFPPGCAGDGAFSENGQEQGWAGVNLEHTSTSLG